MFREFFCGSCKTSLGAWGGLILVVGYAAFLAHIKAQLNEFYSTFYDLLQEGGGLLAGVVDFASGEIGANASVDEETDSGDGVVSYAAYRARVVEQLWRFVGVVAPLVWASPVAKWVRSMWAFAWRMALMQRYLAAWDTTKEPIEGASQRLHEDTQRFAAGIDGCLITLLDATFTLIVFSPILCELSLQVAPPVDLGALRNAWLWTVAWLASVVGLGGAAIVGQKLVGLEVDNQRVEALLRKDLVLLETTPAVIVGTASGDPVGPTSSPPPLTLPPERARAPGFGPVAYFGSTLKRLHSNYHALFRHFSFLNLWLSLYDQLMVLFPYVVAAPLIFDDDPARRITLGTLIKMSNSFEKVFSSLSVIAESWGAINEFRSTLRRLSEFEKKLYAQQSDGGVAGCLLNGGGGSGGGRRRRTSDCNGDGDGGGGAGADGAPACRGNGGRLRETELVVQGEPFTHVHSELQPPEVALPPLVEGADEAALPEYEQPTEHDDRHSRYDLRV